MYEDLSTVEEGSADEPELESAPELRETPEVDETVEAPEPQPRVPVRQHPRIRRIVASVALIGTLTGIAGRPSLRMDAARFAARTVAEFVYDDTPIGWAMQGFDTFTEHEAGWDKPVEAKIMTFNDPEHPTPHDAKVTNFVIPGFREMHDEQITGDLVSATKHDYPTRYVAYGNQPVTPDILAKLIIKNLENDPLKTPEIGFTGHSMGGILVLEALARVHEMGYKLPKVAFIDFLSTPAGMQTARYSGLADFFAKTDIGQRATGALITDTFQQMDVQHFSPKWYFHDIKKALHDIPRGASDALTTSQLHDLDAIDSQQALHDLLVRLKGVITRHTKVTYFGPENPATDTVVDDVSSFNDFWVQFQNIFGISIHYVWWGDGHANPDFDSNRRAKQQLNISMEPKVPPKPLRLIPLPGVTDPSTQPSASQTQPAPIAVGVPATPSTPSPRPSPSMAGSAKP